MRNLIPHFIQTQYRKKRQEGRIHAFTMCVSVSGLTAMSDALMAFGDDGLDMLSSVINRIYKPIVNAIYNRGGFITNFVGHRLFAVFPADDTARPPKFPPPFTVLQSARRIHDQLEEFQDFSTRYGEFPLAPRIGISAGILDWGIVGTVRKAFYFKGPALDGCAAAEDHAADGQTIVDSAFYEFLPDDVVDCDPFSDGFYHLNGVLRDKRQAHSIRLPHRTRLSKKMAAQFLPDALMTRKGSGEYLDVVPVIIHCDGIDGHDQINAWATLLLEHSAPYFGYINMLNFHPKGCVVRCLFGAPRRQENSLAQAMEFLFTLEHEISANETLASLHYQVGVHHGQAFAGFIGSLKRTDYTALGTTVELAERLSRLQTDAGIRSSAAVLDQLQANFDFETLADLPATNGHKPSACYAPVRRKMAAEPEPLVVNP